MNTHLLHTVSLYVYNTYTVYLLYAVYSAVDVCICVYGYVYTVHKYKYPCTRGLLLRGDRFEFELC
jgi:hypothetical protein